MGIVVHSHSATGTYSPWWLPGNPRNLSPWQQCRGWWWGWRRRAKGRRATGWRSCPESQTATSRRPTGHSHPAETHTGNSDTSCQFQDNTLTSLLITLLIYVAHQKNIFRLCEYVEVTQKNRLKRKSMYLMQQMQPRAMTDTRQAPWETTFNKNV